MALIEPDKEDHDWLHRGRGKNEIIWYGERGVVNSLIYAITENNQMRELLRKIRWADDKEKLWVDCIKSCNSIIEIGLNDFGNPDLILVIEDCMNQTHYVFIEAKVNSYYEKAHPNTTGMLPGYNSSINGQLSLKYRFVKALQKWNGKTHEITEPETLYNQYKSLIHEYSKHPRTLRHTQIIEKILKPNKFQNASTANSYYVALTVEGKDSNPFTDAENYDLLPVLLDEEGNNIWSKLKGNIGLLNLEEIKTMIQDPEFKEVYEIMTTKPEPTGCPYRRLATVDLASFSDELVSGCMDFAHRMCKDEFYMTPPVRHKGSISLLDESGITIGKVLPRDNEIWYGIRESNHKTKLEYEERGKWCINNVPFVFYKV